LKISSIDVFQLGEQAKGGSASWASNSIIVRVSTSTGLVGYGEAVPTMRVQPVIQSIREVERVYKGKDPLNVELNMHEWHKFDFYMPVSFDSTTAVSAVDIACWDIIGKHYGAPIHELLGGEFRTRVKVYSNGWYDNCVTPEQFGAKAKEFASRGYQALKFDVFGDYYDYIDDNGLRLARERVRAVRDATDGKVELLIEHHGRFNPNSAIMVANALEEFDPLFMEEPVHPEEVEGLRKYRSMTDARVALGERVLTKEQAAYLMSNDLVDFFQADITNIGGVTQAKKICGIAEAYGVEMAFHNAFGPIQNAVTIQLDASIPNFLMQESFYDVFPQWKRDLIGDSMKVEGGHTAVPNKPGLGIDVDEKVLEEHKSEGQGYFNANEPVWAVKNTWSSGETSAPPRG
jgi:L-alanine-DL-glutamate epimerase-like enolase superfamily enzyme